MKNLVKTILFLFLPVFAVGQKLPDNFIVTTDSDTSFWINYQYDICKQLNIETIFNQESIYNLRITYHGQLISYIVDISQESDSIFYNKTIIYTKEMVPDGESPTNRIYKELDTLDFNTAKKIIEKYIEYKIDSIPSDKFIKQWSRGFDGDIYIIESLNDKNYSFKQYWTPSSQDSITQGEIFSKFIDNVYTIIDFKNKKINFKRRVPFECYNTGGPTTACEILSRKEKRQYKKERKTTPNTQ